MAGGIDWFRWHHGTVTDQKFHVIAKRAQCSVAEAIAVWACLLESASMAEVRGEPGLPDFEAMECALGLQDGQVARIHAAMHTRQMVDEGTGQVLSWNKRQPKREREDETAAERKRRQRERDAETPAATPDITPPSTIDEHVTPRHATSRQETPREEERREEEEKDKAGRKRRLSPPPPPRVLVTAEDLEGEGVAAPVARDWLTLRKAKNLPLTPTAWEDVKTEALKAGISPGDAVRESVTRSWAGFKAQWVADQPGQASHASEMAGAV